VRGCTCSTDRVRRYLGRLSGPLLDRFDLHVEVPHTDYRALRSGEPAESSQVVRERVVAARGRQHERLRGEALHANAEMAARHVELHCKLGAAADKNLERCVKRFTLSNRAVHRVLRVARTIADLAGHEQIEPEDVAESVALRVLDREALA